MIRWTLRVLVRMSLVWRISLKFRLEGWISPGWPRNASLDEDLDIFKAMLLYLNWFGPLVHRLMALEELSRSCEQGRVWRWRRVQRPRERSRSRSRRHWSSRCYPSRRSFNPTLPCGLTHREVLSLLSRDITPEDYELLLRLDEAIPKKPATAEETHEALEGVPLAEFMGRECTICLARFAEVDTVAALPCKHKFHEECIRTWLSNYRRTCPLCCTELESTA
ncbi:unnamed protein product [Effrenium voratum]|nr:unnamed protein product [Effrenium voratum]